MSTWCALAVHRERLDLVEVESAPGEKPRVSRCESYPLDTDLTQVLQRLRQGGKVTGACSTLLSPGEYQFLSVEAPALPAEAPAAELREALRWKVKDMVDFPVTEAGIDVIEIPSSTGRAQQVFVAAASHSVLTPRIRAFQRAKIPLAVIDLPEMAQRNLAQLFEQPQRALALLVFSEGGGLLTFTFKGELYAMRRLEVGTRELTGASDTSAFDRVVLDVQRSLDNFERNFSRIPLGGLQVLPVAGAEKLISHLKDNLYQLVEALDIRAGLDIDGAPMLANPAVLANYLPALGAALRLEEEVAV